MKIVSARVRTYRTVKDETHLEFENGLTLVGPNNVGKTNLLKGIRLFFTGHDNRYGYNRADDLSFNQSSSLTSVSLTFKLASGIDDDILEVLNQITNALSITQAVAGEITLYLSFSSASNPSYRVFPNSKRPDQAAARTAYSRLERQLVGLILGRVAVHYIPSDKSTEQLYSDLVLPFLLRKAFQAVKPHMTLVEQAMGEVAQSLNDSLQSAGLPPMSCSFEFPTDPVRIFRDVHFSLSDPGSTSIFHKGMGIQSAALLAAFNWITREEVGDGKVVLWLLEEPESYLHPELAAQCDRLIDELRSASQVVCTTHSLGFVPQDPAKIVGVSLSDGWTAVSHFKTYHEATHRIRNSLGVRFSDFYNLDHFNLLVEGETDRTYFEGIFSLLRTHGLETEFPILTSTTISCLDQGGVAGLAGFVRATYQFIRDERPCVVILDGDPAGDRYRRELTHYFGNKSIPFQANQQFVVVRDRYAIEGLFPDSWISEVHDEHPGWFSDYAVDASGALLPFSLHDNSKKSFMGWMLNRTNAETNLDWAERWLGIARVLEVALSKDGERIYGTKEDVARVIAFTGGGNAATANEIVKRLEAGAAASSLDDTALRSSLAS